MLKSSGYYRRPTGYRDCTERTWLSTVWALDPYHRPVPELQLVRPDHAPALLAFEQENRAYFAASVPDRGYAYFAGFAERHSELLARQAAGTDLFHVLVAEDGAIMGRVNLTKVAGASAELGFRIAERAAGRGLATAAVRQVCALAVAEYELSVLRAAARVENAGSRTVLIRTGFVPTGEVVLSGRPGITYRLGLTESEGGSASPQHSDGADRHQHPGRREGYPGRAL
jgi:ribosomal-protein-alanine N-acetyltransferase